ncbi:MAG: DUF2752 domain-containing protein [Lachnospiraceae bacterium]|nr:DUF2752 domain-containing protein [Lachnospiraceae bacterium]
MNWRVILHGILHMPCLFHALTGFYCPGCGGTRALRYLLQGQIGLSVQYHPLVLYGVVVFTAEVVSAVIARVMRRPDYYIGHENLFLYIGVGIVLVNWIWKNVMLGVFGIDLLPAAL